MTRLDNNQSWTSDSYDTHARFVSRLAGEVVEWLDIKPGEKLLDLACGDGDLTVELAKAGADVIGIDSSSELLAAARQKGVDARLMDGQAIDFENQFDAVFSNAALHWMLDQDSVLNGVHKALKPQGRFVAEFGGHGNVAAIVTAMRAVAIHRGGDVSLANPWFFPSPPVYRQMLEEHGFTVKRIGLFPRPTALATGMAQWLKLFRQPFFEQFGDQMDDALSEVEELLRPALCDARSAWTADYVRLRFEAVKS